MQMNSVKRTQFADLNDKRYYFHDGIVSLPFGHFYYINVEKKKENIDYNFTSAFENVWVFSTWKSTCWFMWKIKSIKINICAASTTIFIKFTSLAAGKSLKSIRELIINGSWK